MVAQAQGDAPQVDSLLDLPEAVCVTKICSVNVSKVADASGSPALLCDHHPTRVLMNHTVGKANNVLCQIRDHYCVLCCLS